MTHNLVMPYLNLSLLGPFLATVNDKPLTRFRTKTAQALLIYLTCEHEMAHRREYLMALLWPGLPQKSAQGNLRQSLYLLRKQISKIQAQTDGESIPFLLVDNQTIQVNPEAGVELDVRKFESILEGPADSWATAVSLYRGEFLADFYLPDSAPFEEWVLARREALRRQIIAALNQLAEEALAAANFDTAESYARRQIEIDNLYESGYRLLMRALTLSGKRTEALTLYEDFEQLMEKEFRAKPSTDTADLYEAILAEDPIEEVPLRIEKNTSRHIDLMPSFPISGQAPARPLFVGREEELTRLMGFLEEASHGRGQVAFLVGDAGSGKSSLLTTFADKASRIYDGLLVTRGACNAFSGQGDPYLPFRDVLSLLTGDVERAWASGTITTEQAKALWLDLPYALQGLIDYAPNLLDTMIPLRPLFGRVESVFPKGHPLLTTLKEETETASASAPIEQIQLFEQVVTLCQHLAKERPLLIMLDDLQWADDDSIALLFHLVRRLAGSRILIVGAYRQEEVTAVADHPLRPLLDEFRRTFGGVWFDLNQAQGRAFVDAIIDSEANQFNETFRKTLHQKTAGHPLFTVELLRDLQERNVLVQNEDGAWVMRSNVDWEDLPPRVDGVIATRIGRLTAEQREILNAAAVEGEHFHPVVLARVLEMNERRLLRMLAWDLEKRHQLVHERTAPKHDQRQLSQYRFVHSLFQQYLYKELSLSERQLLHGDIAAVLEEMYADKTEEIAVQLARHYIESGAGDKALPYLVEAGDDARRLYAFSDASRCYESALEILKEAGDYESASRLLMKLGLTYHSAGDFIQSNQAYQEAFMLLREAGKQPRSFDHPAPHALRMVLRTILTLDPNHVRDIFSIQVVNQLFGRLLSRTPELNLIPDIAQSWEIRDEGRTYLFHLRDDVHWSDGHPLTAEDFVFALQRYLDHASAAPFPERLYDIVGATAYHRGEGTAEDIGIEALDPTTLLIQLAQPIGPFLDLLVDFFPLPKHIITLHGQAWTEPANIVTSGPFLLESWESGQSLCLRRNPNYYGHFSGNVERIELSLVWNHEECLTPYEADEFDILPISFFNTDSQLQAIQRNASDHMIYPDYSTTLIRFDTTRPPLDNPRLRRALVLATDRHVWAHVIQRGLTSPVTGGLIPPGLPGHMAGTAIPYDPEAARKLMTEAGYLDGRDLPPLKAYVWDRTNFLTQAWERELGLKIEYEDNSGDLEKYFQMVDSKRYHILSTVYFADYPDPDSFMRESMQNYRGYWPDRNYFRLVENARQITNKDNRMQLYQQAEEILIEECPIMPLSYGRSDWLVKPWIKNFIPAAMSQMDWKDIIIEPH